MKSGKKEKYRQIVAAVDFDPDDDENDSLNNYILENAMSLAVSEFAELHVVHAWRLPCERTLRSGRYSIKKSEIDEILRDVERNRWLWLKALVSECAGRLGEAAMDYPKPQVRLVKGRADRVIPDACEELRAELVVMGTVGRVGIPGLTIGNTAEAILSQIDCSVLAVEPAGFVSLVTLDN